jgi:hypothetical protein
MKLVIGGLYRYKGEDERFQYGHCCDGTYRLHMTCRGARFVGALML